MWFCMFIGMGISNFPIYFRINSNCEITRETLMLRVGSAEQTRTGCREKLLFCGDYDLGLWIEQRGDTIQCRWAAGIGREEKALLR